MQYPKVKAVQAMDDYTLVVTFDNKQKKRYDVKPLLNRDDFDLLNNIVLFRTVKVEQGGYAVVWNNTIDIAEYELWKNSCYV